MQLPSVVRQHAFVVPVHGQSPYLEACLASLQAQTLPSAVVVTTATPFSGLDRLAAAYNARVVVNPNGGGIGRDWNFALSQAQAAWVTIAHQDDVYLPDFLASTMALVNADTMLVLTGYAEMLGTALRRHSPMLWIKRALLELGFLGKSHAARISAKRRLLRFGCPIPCPSVTVRTDLSELRFREDLRVNLDWEAWLRLAGQPGAFAYIRKCLLLHRIHVGSETTGGILSGARADEDRMMFEVLWPTPVARLLARAYRLSYAQGG